MSGQAVFRANISNISQAEKCQVTTTSAHGFSTGQLVRITDLGPVGRKAVDRGMNRIDGQEYNIYVDSTTTFLLRDPISLEYVDSTNYVAYVSGGQATVEQTTFEYEGS